MNILAVAGNREKHNLEKLNINQFFGANK